MTTVKDETAPNAGVRLLPCPFCGSNPKRGSESGRIYCMSPDCFGPITSATNQEDSTVQWNNRVALAVPEGVTRAREALETIDRLSLVISSAVRISDPDHLAAVVIAIKNVRAALASSPSVEAGSRERALKIIADEERLAANDSPDNINLYALRLVRVKTAKQILGLDPMQPALAASALMACDPGMTPDEAKREAAIATNLNTAGVRGDNG